jgi:hypothetical protein
MRLIVYSLRAVWLWRRSAAACAGIAGSNSAEDLDVRLSRCCVLC